MRALHNTKSDQERVLLAKLIERECYALEHQVAVIDGVEFAVQQGECSGISSQTASAPYASWLCFAYLVDCGTHHG